MAPEQFEGRVARFGPWTDLYALGCLAWALTCGRRPFTAHGSALRLAHLTWPVPKLQPVFSVPKGLGDWIGRLMSKEPSLRYPFAADAADALLFSSLFSAGLLVVLFVTFESVRDLCGMLASDEARETVEQATMLHPAAPRCQRFGRLLLHVLCD